MFVFVLLHNILSLCCNNKFNFVGLFSAVVGKSLNIQYVKLFGLNGKHVSKILGRISSLK